MSYDGPNPVLLRLQMRFMMWSMDIQHRPDKHLVDADYFSRCGADLCYDPLVTNYLNFTTELRRLHPPCVGHMLPSNMPGFREPRVHSPPSDSVNAMTNLALERQVDPTILRLREIIDIRGSLGHMCLAIVPLVFGHNLHPQTRPLQALHGHYVPVFCQLSHHLQLVCLRI